MTIVTNLERNRCEQLRVVVPLALRLTCTCRSVTGSGCCIVHDAIRGSGRLLMLSGSTYAYESTMGERG